MAQGPASVQQEEDQGVCVKYFALPREHRLFEVDWAERKKNYVTG
jgi:hypothetical protein